MHATRGPSALRCAGQLLRNLPYIGVLADEGFDNALDVTGLRAIVPLAGRLRPSLGGPVPMPARRVRHGQRPE